MTGNSQSGNANNNVQAEFIAKFPPWAHLTLHLIDKVFTTVWLIIKCGFWLGIAYIVYLSIKELAGQTTVAQFILGYFSGNESSSGSSTTIWVIVSVLCGIWAKFERWLRLRKVADMSERIKLLESHIDPTRTSSGLTKSGETPIEEVLP